MLKNGYLSKSKDYRSFLSTFEVKSKSTETQKSTLGLTCCTYTQTAVSWNTDYIFKLKQFTRQTFEIKQKWNCSLIILVL